MMGEGQRYETDWEGLRLVIQEHQEHFQAFVYDPESCEVVYTAKHPNLEVAKCAAVEFAAALRFGPQHGLKPRIVTAMLVWDPNV